MHINLYKPNFPYVCFMWFLTSVFFTILLFEFVSIVNLHMSISPGNRSLCNLDDLALAFDEYQIRLPGLQEYLDGVDQLPFPHEVFQFPVKQYNKHVYESSTPPITASTTLTGGGSSDYDDDEEDEVLSPLIPAYLPPLPSTKEETDKGYFYTTSISDGMIHDIT